MFIIIANDNDNGIGCINADFDNFTDDNINNN